MTESFELPKQTYLDVFHAAQAKLIEGDIEGGKELLVQAADLVGDLDDGQIFSAYIDGTQAYLEKDMDSLRMAIDRVGDSGNRVILERFLATLEAGREVDYDTDYKGL